ncbi:ATP-binding protein [Streptomyces parvulus]|uniref:ATP-binding protein n=1 Tax=Streptomyces parvulus TaxID=146923 RepID=UPI0033E43306
MDHAQWRPTRTSRLSFLANADQVRDVRRALRLQIGHWGLCELADAAETCVGELVANVVKHVGPGTPATLVVSLCGPRLRVEVHDPDARALPTLASPRLDAEAGRGMTMIDATSDRWGVELAGDHKVTWCEFRVGFECKEVHHSLAPRLARAADVVSLYGDDPTPEQLPRGGRLAAALAEEAAISVIIDLLHWFRARGRDVDEALDQAQSRFDAQCEARPF